MKIPQEGYSEAVSRRTDKQMAKIKRTNNDLRNIKQKIKDRATRNPLNIGGELRCSGRSSISCSTCGIRRVVFVTNKLSDKSWMRKGPKFYDDTRYTYVVICDTDTPDKLWWRPYIFRRDDFNLTTRNPWFSSFLVCSSILSRNSWLKPQALGYRINWERDIPYADAAGILLHINGKFTMGKLK